LIVSKTQAGKISSRFWIIGGCGTADYRGGDYHRDMEKLLLEIGYDQIQTYIGIEDIEAIVYLPSEWGYRQVWVTTSGAPYLLSSIYWRVK
jgi:hypothetical protein